jgi:hypothetical protein
VTIKLHGYSRDFYALKEPGRRIRARMDKKKMEVLIVL